MWDIKLCLQAKYWRKYNSTCRLCLFPLCVASINTVYWHSSHVNQEELKFQKQTNSTYLKICSFYANINERPQFFMLAFERVRLWISRAEMVKRIKHSSENWLFVFVTNHPLRKELRFFSGQRVGKFQWLIKQAKDEPEI